ncbi:hypothetical protein Hokovirus_1_174 [Hokovirus HKV1]|uniref:Bacteriophage T5 Orf172 DNA-binding domain-containing protein n=1 Tax=Hokovirus HKV1 TaxID=1977638 RepID=A0A1V0SEZ8_9VIRU|nr:hypothetical protein Hokovirus_1_174 [Hokovirus HKV1]
MKLKEFLKIYTAIPNKFIDGYYKFYEMCEANKFGIEGSIITNYLDIQNLRKFYSRIREKYNLNDDYIIKKYTIRKPDDTRRVEYYFSFDCFEKICMQSRTNKGNIVRDYFITLRKFIAYYHEHFANAINNLVKTKNYVYIILVNKNKNIFKFGRTENIKNRLYSYATGKEKHPDILFIMAVENSKVVENCVKLFAKNNQYKNNKELYKIDFDTLKKLSFDCASISNKLNTITKNKKDFDAYIVYDSKLDASFIDLQGKTIGLEQGKTIKKSSKKLSKKLGRKQSKKQSKKASKKQSKKLSKKTRRKLSKNK